jgi:hypothetical protein
MTPFCRKVKEIKGFFSATRPFQSGGTVMSNTQSNPDNGAAKSGAKASRGGRAKTAKNATDEAVSHGNGHGNGFANKEAEARAREAEADENKTEDELWGTDRKFLVELNPESVANRLHGRVIKSNSGFHISFPNPFAEQNEEDGDDSDDGGDAYGPRGPRAGVCVLSYDPDKPYGFDLYAPPGANYKRIRQWVIDKLLLKETSKLRGKERETLKEKTAKYISDRQREYCDYYDNTERLYWSRATPITRDDPAGKYLNNTRGVPLPEIDDVLRYLPGEKFNSGKHKGELSEPAFMIARALDQETDEAIFFHFTIITRDGQNRDFKCPVSSRAIKRRHTKCGSIGYVPLRPGTYKMAAIGEGLETTSSAFKIPELDGMHVWSALSAKSLAEFPVRPDLDGVALLWDWEPPEPNSKHTAGPGQRAVEETALRYLKAGKEVFIVKPIKPDGKDKWDLNDVINAKDFAPGVGYTYEKFTGLPPDRQEYVSENGKFVLNDINVKILIGRCPEVAQLLSYNEFYGDIMITGPMPGQTPCGPYPRPIKERDCRALTAFVQQADRFAKAGEERVYVGMQMFAESKTTHPLREYLEGLKWDGVPRIDFAFRDYLGVVDEDYERKASSNLFKSAVKRVMSPGCKSDESAVLVGPEATFKSSFCSIIASEEYFSDCMPSLGGFQIKDAQDHLQSNWIVEISEGASFKKAEAERVKNFLTIRDDKYRKAYGHRDESHPRHCIFIITTNLYELLTDRTGNRRLVPVKVGEMFPPTAEHMRRLEENRDQLWAEAYHRVMTLKESWFSEPEDREMFVSRQEAHRDVEYWESEFLRDFKRKDMLARQGVAIFPSDLADYFKDNRQRFTKQVPARDYNTVLRNEGWSYKSRNFKIAKRDERGEVVLDKDGSVVIVSAPNTITCRALDRPEGGAIGRWFKYTPDTDSAPGTWTEADTWTRASKWDDEIDAPVNK